MWLTQLAEHPQVAKSFHMSGGGNCRCTCMSVYGTIQLQNPCGVTPDCLPFFWCNCDGMSSMRAAFIQWIHLLGCMCDVVEGTGVNSTGIRMAIRGSLLQERTMLPCWFQAEDCLTLPVQVYLHVLRSHTEHVQNGVIWLVSIMPNMKRPIRCCHHVGINRSS